MYPVLSFGLRSYEVILVAAIVCAFATVMRVGVRAGFEPDRWHGFLVCSLLGALIGAKLHSIIERFGVMETLPAELFGGYRTPGGLLGAAVILPAAARYWLNGRSLGEIADAVAPGVGIGLFGVRLGCFFNGCCHGGPTDLPWGVVFPMSPPNVSSAVGKSIPLALTGPVHPLQLYLAALAGSAATLALWHRSRQRHPSGETMLLVLSFYGITAGVLEIMRDPREPHLQWALFIIGTLALVMMICRRYAVSGTLNSAALSQHLSGTAK